VGALIQDPSALSLHPLLAKRWSPTMFDADAEVSEADVDILVEAARWAPSAGNSQPGPSSSVAVWTRCRPGSSLT
jgi:nitroreductase